MSHYSARAGISSVDLAEDDWRAAVDPLRGPLFAHCYRMLGSVQDAEDALQEALLRAWRARPTFDTGRALRPWLYRIATNVCLDAIARRPHRSLPTQAGPAVAADQGAGAAVLEPVWLEPLADDALAAAVDEDAPEARYEQRETLELAFLTALQRLPGTQRAALVLCEVLGFTAAEAADMLDTTAASITSALQRARATLDRHPPPRSQRQVLAALGDDAMQTLVGEFVDALQAGDVTRLAALLAEDVRFSMPPFSAWWQGRETVLAFTAADRASRRFVTLRANGQPAFAAYRLDEATDTYRPELLEILTVNERGEVAEITTFVDPVWPCAAEEAGAAMPIASVFARFGLAD